MRILIDTNIFIKREENIVLTQELQELLEIIHRLRHQILIHPLSIEEILKDKKDRRRIINISKLGTYQKLEHPPILDEKNFLEKIGKKELINKNDKVDYNLLYCVYRNAVHMLITEDKEIIRKAKKICLSNRVLTISDALKKFKKEPLPHKVRLTTTPAIKEVFIYNLNLNDPFFNSLKNAYIEFPKWWEKISREGRKAWVYFNNGKLGAILIYKYENESIPSIPPLSKKRRVKISTLKVSYTGFRIGELLIKLAINFAVKCKIDEIYLSHFSIRRDPLLKLIKEFGFCKKAVNEQGEEIFVKKIIAENLCRDPIEVQKLYYPSFYDGREVKKFIVPIQPDFHDRLFTDYDRRQPRLYEFIGELIVPGNTIKKAYICHSNTKKISPGDILMFYRSQDKKMLTSIGVVEKIFNNVFDPNKIQKEVGNRTVYSREEIIIISKKPTKIILFYFNFHFPKAIHINELIEKDIISGYLQSIREITHDNYLTIRKMSDLDTSYCVDELKIS